MGLCLIKNHKSNLSLHELYVGYFHDSKLSLSLCNCILCDITLDIFCLDSERAQLTVGARALAKHCHRDSTNSWWGSSLGSKCS